MKIGVLSDTHDNVDTLQAALDILRRQDIYIVIHCGDLTSAQIVPLFSGLELHLAQGNVDSTPAALARAVLRLGNGSTYGQIYEGEFDGARVAAIHGDDKAARKALQESGLYHYVFHGHTHERKNKLKGKTRVVNPGALGGKRVESRSFCTVNLEIDDVCFVDLG